MRLQVAAEDVEQVVRGLQRDFEGTCVAIASEVAASEDPTHWLDLLLVVVRNGTADCQVGTLPAEQVERLEMDLLPQLVQLLLGKSFHLSAVEGVHKFLQWTLTSVADRFQHGDASRLSCVARVLDAHRRFYLYHGTSNDGTALDHGQGSENNENDENQRQRTLQFTVHECSEYTSRYFLHNLERWGQVGGFSLFLGVLRADASFEVLQCILRIVYDVKEHLNAAFLAEYFPQLADAVCTHIRNLQAAEFYGLARDSLLEVVQVMELLLVKTQHDVEITSALKRGGESSENGKSSVDESDSSVGFVSELCEQRVQLLRLEISLRFFQSSSLEKRIYGLTEIVVIITRLYNDQIQEQAEPTVASLLATLRFLVEWMHEKQLMHELLGEKMHVELVKRSTSLFQFVSELECLPTEWIDLVWNCYHSDIESIGESRPIQRRHEAFRSSIHDLLLEMVTFMELPALNHLVKRIQAVQAKLDSNQLGLLAAIAARRLVTDVPSELPQSDESIDIPRQRSLRQRILVHLWTVVLPSKQSQDFCDEVLLRMHEMLRSEALGDDVGETDDENTVNNCTRSCEMVDDLLRSCLDNISRRRNLMISLKLFAQLSSLIVDVNIVLSAPRQLDESYVKLMMEEIVRYKSEVQQTLQATEWYEMDDDKRANLFVLKNHVNEIKYRLLALRASWILDKHVNTAESFTEDQLDVMWQLAVADAFLLDEAALCFQWIELCMNTSVQVKKRLENDSPRELMPLSMAEHLIKTKFPTLTGDCITLSTLCCFHSIFRRINLVNGGLEVYSTTTGAVPSPTGRTGSGISSDDDKDESVELLTGQPLVGLDELWQLAVTATDSAVAEEIITLLASYHLAFAPSARETQVSFRCKMRFVEKCMEFIATAKAGTENIQSQLPAGDQDAVVKTLSSANVGVVNRCVDLLRYFLEACKIGEESENESLTDQLQSERISVTTDSDDGSEGPKKSFRIEHLEERLPYLEIYPSPMKDLQSDAPTNYRAGRRPSWTFRQQHALLDVIVDSNEEVDTEDTTPSQKDEASRRSETECSPLKVELRTELLNKSASPIKTSTRSPCVRANLRWPQAPSPQRGPDLRPEDIDQALTDYSGDIRESYVKDKLQARHSTEPAQTESIKLKARYGVMSQILANQDSHFDVLLDLVDWDETTSQRTWDLLCRLPTNNELLRKMIRLRRVEKDKANDVGDVVNWSGLLDGSSIQRLLYALRLVEALLIPLEATGNGNGEFDSGRRQWRERFVRLGGARHLYETLLKWPEQHWPDSSGDGDSILSQYAQNLRATCLAAVMRVLNYFFHWSRQNAPEKTQQTTLSLFDTRLKTSTLPEFVKTVELSSMFQVAVQLTMRFCARKCSIETSFSEESAEAVYCGVQMCCSLIHFSPHLIAAAFETDQDTGGVSADDSCSRSTLRGWLKALMVDCPSKSTRCQVLGVLSEMAAAFGAMDCCSPARKLFDPLIVSACDLAAQDVNEVGGDTSLEELFAFCKVTLRSCGFTRSSKTTSDYGEDNDMLAGALLRKRIPGRLKANLLQMVSQQRADRTFTSFRTPRNQDVGILSGYLQLLTLLAKVSDQLRTTILRTELSSEMVASCASNNVNGEMIDFIHDKLLFGDTSIDHNIPNLPICKTRNTRKLAQDLLLTLVFPQTSGLQKPDGDFDPDSLNCDTSVLLQRLGEYQGRVLETVNLSGRQWNYSPADAFLDTTKSTQHAGLVNPGCICYMNALVQQLFMTPSFCEGLLALDCSQISADTSSSWKDEVEQLQRLFVSLAYTNYRSCDPTTFALSHKDMDGNSTDVHLQMDADEFFSLLLDRLEMFIRPKTTTNSDANTDQDFMGRCFGGVLVNQILTQQGHLSEREEKFFALSLEVCKKRHLAESLELYVQGESLEGENAYFCEREQRKVSATKRVCIKTLPQTLICHLKRFEFDYDTMEKMKINDFLEFPMEIDMFPYTSEALSTKDSPSNGNTRPGDKTIMYDLVGVVVHSGTSDTGHYYSFIKDRHGVETQRWLEFNDEVVREFDVDTMGDECFGGEEVAQKWDPIQGAYSPIVQMKRRSAYMLIYERRSPTNKSSMLRTARSIALSVHAQDLATQMMQENARYESVVNVFDPSYEQFVQDLIKGVMRLPAECDPQVSQQACQLVCQFLFGIRSLRCRISGSSTSPPASPSAKLSYDKDSRQICLWLSNYQTDPSCEGNDVRVQFSKWLLAETVASPTNCLTRFPSTALHHVESQRTWLFDVLFLSSESPELADTCFQVLVSAVSILAQESSVGNEAAESSLTNFFREVLNLFFLREPHLEVCDPASGCVLTLSIGTRVTTMKQLGVFIEKYVNRPLEDIEEDGKSTVERVFHRLFLGKLNFLNRFLNTLQIPFETSDIIASTANSPVSSRGIEPLAIETRTTTPKHELDLQTCMLRLETKLLRVLVREPASPSVDSTLLLNHTALKNVVLLGLEDVVVPVLTRIIFESESPSSKCDRLVALLIGVLEEVKDTHTEKVLAVFGSLLDAEEEQMKSGEEAGDSSGLQWTVHRQVFSPSRGILESVVYYRDHRGSHAYTLLLLGFTVHRVSRSPVLQELFMNEPQFCSHVNWIPGWLVDHLDSNGAVRENLTRRESEDGCSANVKTRELEEVEKLFAEVEKAFGVTIPAYCPDETHGQQALTSPASSPSAVASEDVILEALDLKENKHKLAKRQTDEVGPEHEDTEHEHSKADWKLHRSREDLSMLLRIDLDITHNNAREA